jgi:hypothetical protein
LEGLSRAELIALVVERDARIEAQDARIEVLVSQVAELSGVNEGLVGKVARLEHLLSRNSRNSSVPPSRDDDLGRRAPERPEGSGWWAQAG